MVRQVSVEEPSDSVQGSSDGQSRLQRGFMVQEIRRLSPSLRFGTFWPQKLCRSDRVFLQSCEGQKSRHYHVLTRFPT